MAKNWMKNAVHPNRKGEFTRKAKAAGMSVAEFAAHTLASGSKASTRTKRQAAFAKAARSIAAGNR